MQYSEAKQGRVFVIRLEDGEVLHETVESFAREHGIRAASLLAVGGADAGSRLVVGPREDRAQPVEPMEHILEHAHELAGVGTLFPGENGNPVLHMHAVCGREGRAVAGCIRRGVRTWHVLEIVLYELTGTAAARRPDPETGFALLRP
ncbi:MAG: DNA-binding protein [Lentisphaerae bacterium]|nr:DNA-binding protein [Lentisphaerota bacterium]